MFNLFTRKKLKFSYYGNCQIQNISNILNNSKEFCEKYEFVPTQPVHLLKDADLETISESFKDLDLLLYQNVSTSFKNGAQFASSNILKLLKQNCKAIQIPSLFFNAYFPDIHEVIIEGYGAVNTPFMDNYHDLNILFGYVNGYSVKETLKIYLDENYYEKSFCQKTLENSFERLKAHEVANKVDIAISDFIEANYKKLKLFNSLNHPKQVTLQYILDNILRLIKFKIKVPAIRTSLDNFEFPIHPNVYKNLDLNFENKIEFINGDKVIESYQEFIASFYEEYKKFDIELLKKGFKNTEHITANYQRY